MAKQKRHTSPGSENKDMEFKWRTERDVPMLVRNIFRRYKLTFDDFGITHPLRELQSIARGTGPDATSSRRQLDKVQLLVLNLMRRDSGSDFTTDKIDDWDIDDLVGDETLPFNCGNDELISIARSAPSSPRKGVAASPKPGYNFRCVADKEVWEVVILTLTMWNPEYLQETKPQKYQRMLQSETRRVGLEYLKKVGLGVQVPDATPEKTTKNK